jgi:hypothetical protein
VGVALFSYDGSLQWGVHADYDALPDSDKFVAALQTSFNEMKNLAGR